MAAPGAKERDNLTGLKNFQAFSRVIEEQIHLADRQGSELSLALVDLDWFKSLNDRYGHIVGDEIIRATGRHLADSIGKAGLVFRYGGEEFALLLPGMEREQALLLLERVRADFDREHEIETEKGKVAIPVAFSVGIASFPADGAGAKQVVSKADDALYRAKTTGRNKVSLSREEKMVTKTSHYTAGQLQRLSKLAKGEGVGEAVLLREALDDILRKYDKFLEPGR